MRFVSRNLVSINHLLDAYPVVTQTAQVPVGHQHLYDQQLQMYSSRTDSVDHRIVSIHQPHVRPIVRGMSQAKVEFGAKIHVSLIDGISFLDELSWNAFNEGSHMIE